MRSNYAPTSSDPVGAGTGDAPSDLALVFGRPINIRSLALSGIFVLLALHALAVGRSLLFPMLLALLASFTLAPLVRVLHRLRVPRAVGAGVVLAAVLAAASLGVAALREPAAEWVDRAPRTLREVERKLVGLRRPLEDVADATQQVEALTAVGPTQTPRVEVRESLFTSLFVGTGNAVSTTAVTVVLLYFLLASGDAFLRKIVSVLPRFADKRRATLMIRSIEADVSRHLLTIALINAALGASVALLLWLCGMPNAPLWGALAGLLNFIPFIGALTTAVIVAVVALISLADPGQALLVPLAFVALTSIEGFLVTPALLGRRLSLSPVVVFVSLLLWSWLWGIPGAFVAVPVLVMLRIVCQHVEGLQALGVLLGPDPRPPRRAEA